MHTKELYDVGVAESTEQLALLLEALLQVGADGVFIEIRVDALAHTRQAAVLVLEDVSIGSTTQFASYFTDAIEEKGLQRRSRKRHGGIYNIKGGACEGELR